MDIVWEDLSFVYSAGVDVGGWDASTQSYSEVSSVAGWKEGTGIVRVTNHSNTDVDVAVTSTQVHADADVILENSSFTLDSGVGLTYDTADSNETKVTPEGALSNGDSNVTIATLTVTITNSTAE